MGVLFISHSSKNNDRAIRVRDWLRSQGHGEVFLDLDPAHGLAPGHRWQEELKRAGENCAAVVVLISPDWAASTWCQTEFLVADQLGKRIFPVLVAPTPLESIRIELRAKFQMADISAPELEEDGLRRLAVGLKRAGLDPKSFDWPPAKEPTRPVYRGLQALDTQDAAVFFGRDAAITRGLDELRRLRDGAAQKVLVILGASGAGKSSFLRAGLIARLERDDENFLVLPVVRPGNAAVSGPEGLLASLAKAMGAPVSLPNGAEDLSCIFTNLRAPVVDRLARNADAAREPRTAKPPTIVIPLDQAEELFGAENAERREFCDLLAEAVVSDGNVIVVATIRSDSYEPLQTELSLAALPQLLFNLQPIAAGSFQEVINGPARLAMPPLVIEAELTQALLADLDTADALPLLAFALERLLTKFGGAGKLTHQDYAQGLGGISGAIQSAITDALGAFPSPDTLAATRRLFLPALVQVDQESVKRRVARRQDIPAEAQALANRFIDQRLLISDRRVIEGRQIESVEVAHEAILRQWPALKAWIGEDREALRTLDGVRAAARDWRMYVSASGGADSESWLIHHGERLKAAEAVAARKDFSALVDPETTAYLAACSRSERKAASRQRRLQALVVVSAVAVLAVVAAWQNWDTLRPHFVRLIKYDTYVRANTPSALAALKPGDMFQDCRPGSPDCPVMIIVPAGELDARNAWRFSYGKENARPRLTVGRFAVSRTEITFDHWDACIAAGGCRTRGVAGDQKWGRGTRPVINVGWDDAQEYVRWLSQMTGADYRLLGDLEWEYAATGRNDPHAPPTVWSFGEDATLADQYAWFDENSNSRTHPVGVKRPNGFGLFDMHGNVKEWVGDCFDELGGGEEAAGESSLARSQQPCRNRVVRGGSWLVRPHELSLTEREWRRGDLSSSEVGFRVARTLPPDGG